MCATKFSAAATMETHGQLMAFLQMPPRVLKYDRPPFGVDDLKAKFATLAVGKSGLVTPAELKTVLVSAGMDAKSVDANVAAFFKMVDTDNSGSVHFQDYVEEYTRMQSYRAVRIVQAKVQATTGSGDVEIDKDTLLAALSEYLGPSEAKTQLANIVREADASPSRKVTLHELVAWYFRQENTLKAKRTTSLKHLPGGVPISVLADSYKAAHFMMYPSARRMTAYGEFRAPFDGDKSDTRFVFYGIRYIVENYLSKRWTEQDVEQADLFYRTHNLGCTPFPYPKDLFLKFVRENNGYFPVKLEALPEGTVANIHVPVYQITAEGEYSRLATFLETILTHVWYPTTVATLSRRTKELIDKAFEESVDPELYFLANSRLHDFGFRGTTCVEQSIIGGAAHMVNFEGSDTVSAAYYAQFHLNNGKPVATSIPATEHSVMTSWPSERAAIANAIERFGGEGKVFAVVMDSYDYANALSKVIPTVATLHTQTGGLMVLRPDSGDPVDCILSALKAGEQIFGATVNQKGYKVLPRTNVGPILHPRFVQMVKHVSCIQGDGINIHTVKAILNAAHAAGYSAANIAFGMGGGLLQKVNRDTMSFATKLNLIVYEDGTVRNVMKRPKTDGGKYSFPGLLKVKRVNGQLTVFPRELDEKEDKENELKVVYDRRPIPGVWDDFDTIRARVNAQWTACSPTYDPVSEPLKEKIAQWIKDFDANYAKQIEEAEEMQKVAASATAEARA